MNVCFWLGLVTALLNMQPMQETWAGLGGVLRMVQTRFGLLLPEVLPLLMCAATAFAFDEAAVLVSPWATPYSTMALIWQSAAACLVVVVLGVVLAAAAVWEVGFLLHAGIAIAFLPLAAVTLLTSSVTLSRSDAVYPFVLSNWRTLQNFVPPAYPHQTPDKYAADSYTPMAQAGVSGLLLSLLLWCGAVLHLRAANIMMSVGPELAEMQGRAEARQRARHLRAKRAALEGGGAVKAGNGAARWAGGDYSAGAGAYATPAYAPAGEMQDVDLPPSPPRAGAGAPPPAGSRDYYSGASSTGVDSPLAGAGGGVGGGGAPGAEYGGFGSDGTAPTGSAAALAMQRFRAAAYARGAAGKAGSAPLLAPVVAPGGATGPRLHVAGDAGEANPYHHEGMMGRVSRVVSHVVPLVDPEAAAVYFSYLGPESEEAPLEERVVWPGLPAFLRAMRIEGVAEWVSHRVCFLAAAGVCLVALAGMAGGLTALELRDRCGVLARDSVTTTFRANFSVYDANRHAVFITNEYPYGTIEIIAPKLNSRSNNFTLEVTSWAPTSDLLLSQADFMAGVDLSEYVPLLPGVDDDTVPGFASVHLTFRPPADAAVTCRALRIRLYSTFYTQYSVVSSRAMVNVTGDLEEVSSGQFTTKTVTSINVTTGDGAVVLTNLHVEPANAVDPVRPVSGVLVRSTSGDVTLKGILGLVPTVTTGGTIRSSNVVSSAPLLGCRSFDDNGNIVPAICGNIYYTTTGGGRVSVSQGLAGNNIYIRTESGTIIGANAAIVAAHDVTLTSVIGDVFLSTFIQAYGNQTFVTSGGKISMTAVFVNRLFVTALGASSVSAYELFIGVGTPGALVLPLIVGNNSDPLLYVRADRGDVTIIGAGGNTGATPYANMLSIDLASGIGNVKLEVSGGGFNGACDRERGVWGVCCH